MSQIRDKKAHRKHIATMNPINAKSVQLIELHAFAYCLLSVSLSESFDFLEESILQSLKEFKKLTYGKVNELKNKYQVTTIHLLQCIIKNNLSYNSMPTFIWKTKKPIICDLLLSPENKMLLKGSTDIINNDKT